MKQTKPAQAMELRSLSPVFGRHCCWVASSATEPATDLATEASHGHELRTLLRTLLRTTATEHCYGALPMSMANGCRLRKPTSDMATNERATSTATEGLLPNKGMKQTSASRARG